MNRKKHSNNFRMLRSISSKMRQIDSSTEARYLIVYSFLFKYCSDRLKCHISKFCRQKSIPFNEAYKNEIIMGHLKNEALDELGYFIDRPDFFIGNVIEEHYHDRFFMHPFYSAFRDHIEFGEDSKYGEYFSFIFSECDHVINFNKFEFTNPNHLIVKEIIFAISKLDIFENEFPFEKVFDRVCQSKLIDVDHDPDYLNFLISSIVSSRVKNPVDVFNPFLNDASLLINLYSDCEFPWKNTYAKAQDEFGYCCSLIKLLVYGFDLNHVCSEFGSPFEPLEDLSLKFDVIMSRFPPITSKNLKRLSINQSYELLKQNKVNQVKSLLSDQLNIDENSFEQNSELNVALENLIDKMDLDLDLDAQFVGEYESLKESEYLFLINMINSLKDDGIMVVSMHHSFLVKNSLETLRKFLTLEKNYVDAVISVPNELSRLPKLSGLEIIMVFRKNRNTDKITFIDLSKDFKTQRERYILPGSFKKNLILSDGTISKVLDAYNNKRVIDKFSNVVSLFELRDNDFNLSISRYVDTFEGEFIRLEDLKSQKMEIDKNRKRLNKKIDLMMRELDIRL